MVLAPDKIFTTLIVAALAYFHYMRLDFDEMSSSNTNGLSEDEIDRMKREAEEHASEDKQKREVVEIRNRAEILVHSTQSALEEHGDKVSQEARGEIESAISNLEEKVKGDDGSAIEAAMNQLETASAELGKAVYEATSQEATANAEEASESAPKNDDDVIDAEYEVKDD